MERLAKRLNSGEVMDVERDEFYVDLTFVRRFGRGGKKGRKKENPGRFAWEKMVREKRCVVQIKTQDELGCTRAIVTMEEKADNGPQYDGLRRGRPFQEVLAKQLHRDVGVAEGPYGYSELKKFQEFWVPNIS